MMRDGASFFYIFRIHGHCTYASMPPSLLTKRQGLPSQKDLNFSCAFAESNSRNIGKEKLLKLRDSLSGSILKIKSGGKELQTMQSTTKVVSTKSEDWQEQCQKLASEKVPFEIHEIESKHFEMCRSVCSQYNYGYKYRMSGNNLIAELRPR